MAVLQPARLEFVSAEAAHWVRPKVTFMVVPPAVKDTVQYERAIYAESDGDDGVGIIRMSISDPERDGDQYRGHLKFERRIAGARESVSDAPAAVHIRLVKVTGADDVLKFPLAKCYEDPLSESGMFFTAKQCVVEAEGRTFTSLDATREG